MAFVVMYNVDTHISSETVPEMLYYIPDMFTFLFVKKRKQAFLWYWAISNLP